MIIRMRVSVVAFPRNHSGVLLLDMTSDMVSRGNQSRQSNPPQTTVATTIRGSVLPIKEMNLFLQLQVGLVMKPWSLKNEPQTELVAGCGVGDGDAGTIPTVEDSLILLSFNHMRGTTERLRLQ